MNSGSWKTPFLGLLTRILLVAAAYVIAGKLGLLLAIPPGYATAVWPASGIALAAVLLWGNVCWVGIALGSFLVNVSTSLDASNTAALVRSLLLAAGIGGGAAVQALAGAWLVRRFAGFPDVLSMEGRIIRLLVLGGPVSCLINPCWGVFLLSAAGLLHPEIVVSNGWTWWVGDSIGVMIFTPLMLLWADRSHPGWRRQALVSAPLAVIFAVVVALFLQSSRTEQDRIRREFELSAQVVAESLQEDLNRSLEALYAVEGLFAASKEVERDEFWRFTAPLLEHHPDLEALSWSERIPDSRRKAYETRLAGEGFPGAFIMEKKNGRFILAGRREEYVPVTYIEPLAENIVAVGYDVSSSRLRSEAMQASEKTRSPAATAPVDLIQGAGRRRSVVAFLPIFKAGARPEGYVAAYFVLRKMLEPRLGAGQIGDLSVELYDDAAPAGRRLLYGIDDSKEKIFALDLPLTMADRPWRLHFTASPAYLVTHRSGAAWNLLAGGLLLAGILGALLLVVTGRTARVEEEVSHRTAELRARQSERDTLLVELERANRELSDFAHIVSHDLKAPLRGISSLSGWVLEDHGEKLGEEGRGQLVMLQARVRRMADLIDGILQYSRIGRVMEEKEDVDLNVLVGAVVDLLSPPEGISIKVAGSLPVVRGNAVRLQQVFQNLIGNAVKHMDKPEGNIEVTCSSSDGRWCFCVADDGPGIEERHFQKIFQIFQTLSPRDKKENTGVGLAIVKKVVQAEGGRAWVESKVGEGSKFYFNWPVRPVCAELVPAGRAS